MKTHMTMEVISLGIVLFCKSVDMSEFIKLTKTTMFHHHNVDFPSSILKCFVRCYIDNSPKHFTFFNLFLNFVTNQRVLRIDMIATKATKMYEQENFCIDLKKIMQGNKLMYRCTYKHKYRDVCDEERK